MPSLNRGLWGFKTITFDPHNSRAVRVVFHEHVSNVHKKQLMDAMYAWMQAQKIIRENSGRPLTGEQVTAMLEKANELKQQRETQRGQDVQR